MSPRPGFVSGVRAFLWGVGKLVAKPAWWPLALVPMAMACLLTIALGFAGVKLAVWLLASIPDSAAWWRVPAEIALSFVAIVLACFVALGLAQPLAGPALEALVRRVEQELGLPERPSTPFLLDVWRSLVSALLGALFGLPFLILAFLVNLIPGGTVVAIPLKFLVVTIALAWDLCDYPLSVRGLSIGARVRFIAAHFWSVLGFSVGISLVALLPCGGLLILPAGVVGATRLLRDVDNFEHSIPR